MAGGGFTICVTLACMMKMGFLWSFSSHFRCSNFNPQFL